jgi:hypothetical protein
MNGASPATRRLLGERIARHGLHDRAHRTALEAVARTTAVQAQDSLASRLGLRARAPLDDAAVRAAIEDDRSIVRTWLMRGTIHLVASSDLRWLVRLFGPAVIRKFRTRWQQLGLTDDLRDRYVAALAELLKGGPMTRAEIKAALDERGLTLESEDPQAHTHALVYASCVGLVCRGHDRGREATFALIDEWLPGAPAGPDGDDALAELARRYFSAYSPATAADFTTWAGLGAKRAVELIRDELTPVDVDGRPGFRLGAVEPARGVRLLPAFDNYLLGYRDRAAIVAPEWQPFVYQGGLIRPTALVDGRVTGAWRLDRGRGEVTLEPFEPWSPAVRRLVDAEVADVGRFLGREVRVVSG